MDVVLTFYPLTEGFVQRLRGLLEPDPTWLSISELRQLPLRQMLMRLRTTKAERVLLPMEDDSSKGLLPILKALAALIPGRTHTIVDKNMHFTAFSRHEIFASAISACKSSVAGQVAVKRASKDTAELLRQPRIEIAPETAQRVLFLNTNLWFGVKAGGSVGHISGVVNGLIDKGLEVDYLSVGDRLLFRDAVRHLPLTPPSEFGFPWETNLYRFHFNAVRQVEAYAEHRPTLIYQRLTLGNYSGVSISRKLGVPLIIEYNGSEAWIAKNWGKPLGLQKLAEDAEAVCLRHAHLIVTISDVLRDELRGRGVPDERIVTYPNCIDREMFDPARFKPEDTAALRARWGIKAGALVATFVGTFGAWHGAERYAAAVRELLDTDPAWIAAHDAHFLFIGDGMKMPEVRKILGHHIGAGHVTLTGLVAQHETPAYLAASDIFISPHVPNADGSRFFGSPTKLFEYMAMGKAIIASDLDQIGDVLKNGMRIGQLPKDEPGPSSTAPGLLVEPGSVPNLMDGLRFLINRPDWRRSLGKNAQNLANSRYTWKHHVEAIISGADQMKLISQLPDVS